MYEIIDELSICSDYLFVKIKGRNVGEAMHYSDIYSLFKRLKHKTSINVHPHLFRHTHATVFYNETRILNKFKKDSVIVIYKRLLIYMFIPLKKIYVKIGIKLSINFKFLIKGDNYVNTN